MRNIKLTLTYNGNNFCGFQRQPDHLSVQGELERALELVVKEKVKLKGAGRTDSNVHALGQVANFKTHSLQKLQAIQKSVNARLAPHISVLDIEEVPLNFHSRFDAQIRIYHYYIHNEPFPHPLLYNLALNIKLPLNLKLMQQAARLFPGERNFASFTLANYQETSLVRTIYKFEVESLKFRFFPFCEPQNFIVCRIEASSFLPLMVRMMIGSLIRVGLERLSLETLQEVIASCGKRMGGPAVKACGLYLMGVKY
jgi:tRNA pseudouridine38-40 synthase